VRSVSAHTKEIASRRIQRSRGRTCFKGSMFYTAESRARQISFSIFKGDSFTKDPEIQRENMLQKNSVFYTHEVSFSTYKGDSFMKDPEIQIPEREHTSKSCIFNRAESRAHEISFSTYKEDSFMKDPEENMRSMFYTASTTVSWNLT
jgi:hypothetical protein